MNLRSLWLVGVVALSVGSFAAAITLAHAGSASAGPALAWLLFVGSAMHVASTGWFYTVPEIRAHARRHHVRFVTVPIALVVGGAAVAPLIPQNRLNWALLAYFAWQFFHFQKQNLGMSALAASATRAGRLGRVERLAVVASGIGGIGGLLTHPDLLQLSVGRPLGSLFWVSFALFVAAVAVGVGALARRPQRPASFVAVYLIALLFFLPVFCFASPYAAVAGLTIAHGYQYLLIVGMVAGAAPDGRRSAINLAVLLNLALLGGLALDFTSHLHGTATAGRILYGAYLGAVMAHFVIDAGLWRLREEFPRAFLTSRLPYLFPDRRVAAVQPRLTSTR